MIEEDLASLARPPARHPHGGGLSYAVHRAAFASALYFSATAARRSPFSLRPLPRSRLGNPAGCAVPGEGIDSARCCGRSSMPGKRRQTIVFCTILRRQPARLPPSPIRITPRRSHPSQTATRRPPPQLKCQSRSRPERRHIGFHLTPRRRIRENPVMYSSPLRVYRSFHCAP